jgi:hypothetical protein
MRQENDDVAALLRPVPLRQRFALASGAMLTRLTSSSVAALLLSTACAASGPSTENARPVVLAPTWVPAAPLPPIPVWRLGQAASPGLTLDLGAGFSGVVHQGVRLVVDGSGTVYARSEHQISTQLLLAVPEHLGGGFVFGGSSGLWHAASFVDPPRMVVAGPVRTLSFGPEHTLVVRGDGSRRLVDLATGELRAVSPLGASMMASSGDGRSGVAYADGGRLFGLRAGAGWQEITPRPGGLAVLHVTSLEAELRIDARGGESFVFGPQGLQRSAQPPPPRAAQGDTRRVRPKSPLALAAARGAPLFDDQVIAFDAGSAFVISMRSGKVLAEEPGATPPDFECRAARFDREVLALCHANDRTLVATRPVEGGPTKVEISFPRRGVLSWGEGDALSFDGPCDGKEARVGAACLRSEAGWIDLDRSAMLEDAPNGATARRLLDVPTRSTVLSIVAGANAGLVDLGSGRRWPLDAREIAAIEPWVSPRQPVEHRARVIGEGELEMWSDRGQSLRVLQGGKQLQPSPYRFANLRFDGARGLARSGAGADAVFLQSTDWGRSFAAVDTPPLPRLRESAAQSCSEVGCRVDAWVRIGWSSERGGADGSTAIDVPVSTAESPRLPELRCTPSTPPVRRLGAGADDARFGLGAERLQLGTDVDVAHFALSAPDDQGGGLRAEATRAVITGRSDENASAARSVRYIDPFDPSATPRSARYDLQAAHDHAALTGTSVGADHMLANDQGFALPVLGGGLLLSDGSGSLLWVAGAQALPISLGPESADFAVHAAARLDASTLAVLARDSFGRVAIYRVTRGSVHAELELPAPPRPELTPSVLGLALGDDGALGVLVSSSSGPPTREDPALLFVAGKPPTPLAAWHTLEPASSPACADRKGAALALAAPSAWLSTGAGIEPSQATWLALRWSGERVCLEAVDAPGVRIDTPVRELDARTIARFDAKPSAGLVALGEGVELRDRRSCELVHARRPTQPSSPTSPQSSPPAPSPR